MAAGEPDWDPQPAIKKIRSCARRLDHVLWDLVEVMEEIPRPAWKDLDELQERKRPLSAPDHLLAVIEEGAGRLARAIGDLRYGARKHRFKEHEREWRAGLGPSEEVIDRIHDALDRLEALAADRQSSLPGVGEWTASRSGSSSG